MRKDGFAGYFVKCSGGGKWTLFRCTVQDGKRISVRIQDDRVDAMNRRGLTKEAAGEQLRAMARKMTLAERARDRAVMAGYNLRLLERYLEEVVGVRPLKDPAAAKNLYTRAVRLVGDISLRTATQPELQRIVNRTRGHAQKKLITALRGLLEFAGRSGVELHARFEDEEIQYLLPTEWAQVRAEVPADQGLLAALLDLAWATGLRNGELHGVSAGDMVAEGVIYVQRQRLTDAMAAERGRQTDIPKNRRKRKVVIMGDEGLKAWDTWTSVGDDERRVWRVKAGEWLQGVTQRLWPRVTRTHGRMHMLRASHAVELIGRGVGISFVALQLGDSVEVTQRHYAGFVHSDSSVEALQRTLNANGKS
jgi:integrase